MVLLEDANDLVDFIEATGRTIPRHLWAEECRDAAAAKSLESMF